MPSSVESIPRRRFQASLTWLFIIVFTSLYERGGSGCSILLADFDSLSASSFPCTPQCEGIHCRVMWVLLLRVCSSSLVFCRSRSDSCVWKLCRTDQQSVKNTVFEGRFSLALRVSAAREMADASAL